MSCLDPVTGVLADCSDPNYLADQSYTAISTDTLIPPLDSGTCDLFGNCYDTLSAGSVPGTATIPSSGTTISGSSSGSGFDLNSIFSGLGNLAAGIGKAVQTISLPATASLSPTVTAHTPYPVVVNGQTVGWSSVPQTPTGPASGLGALASQPTLMIVLIAVIGIYALGKARR